MGCKFMISLRNYIYRSKRSTKNADLVSPPTPYYLLSRRMILKVMDQRNGGCRY